MKKNLSVFKYAGFTLIMIVNAGCSVFGIRSVEEAHYTVKIDDEDKEIREYGPRIIARTTVLGDYKDAQRKAFRILADYIFGKNGSNQEIGMKGPVTHQKASTKIAMTAPVTQEKSGDGWTLSFTMPSKFKSIAALPRPIDERIELLEKPGGIYAAIRFTWLTNEEKNSAKTKELMEWLAKKNQYRSISLPTYAGYNPPWTLPFLRRQEIMVEVQALVDENQK